jgi:inosine-uridine nucleoside N-ribohydrolase
MLKHLILDTDIDTDCDDVGALAILHTLIDQGECELLGVVCSVPIPECVGAVRAINACYGRETIPVGLVEVADYRTSPNWQPYREAHAGFLQSAHDHPYNAMLAKTRPANDPPPVPAVALYRQLLASAAEASVTICAIGTLTALAQLLVSPPDQYSPLTGQELVREKVCELVSMAVLSFPNGCEEFNWRIDPLSAADVLHHWPTAMTVSPTGNAVCTGARFTLLAPVGHPVREAYVNYLGAPGRNRSSWDLIATLYAVRGMAGPFARTASRQLTFAPETAQYQWGALRPDELPPRRLLDPLLPDADLATLLEDLMIAGITRA